MDKMDMMGRLVTCGGTAPINGSLKKITSTPQTWCAGDFLYRYKNYFIESALIAQL